MINYNSDNVIVGYIKQLLHNCNITKFMVYKEGVTPVNGFRYIKDGAIYLYINNTWVKEQDYTPGANIGFNLIKNLRIDSINYDTHTHEFLGEYLRFKRDYFGIDLMPLYNCYNGQSLNTFEFSFNTSPTLTITKKAGLVAGNTYHFNIVKGTEVNALRKCMIYFSAISNVVTTVASTSYSGNSVFERDDEPIEMTLKDGTASKQYNIPLVDGKTDAAIAFDGTFTQFHTSGGINNIEDLLAKGCITKTVATQTIKTTANDPKYKVYPVPVKYFSKYTIAIECPTEVKMVCAQMYNDEVYTTSASEYLYQTTYASYNNLRFNEPIVYDKINNINLNETLFKHYETLYLLILVPFDNNSSVVVLEGDYSNSNDFQMKGMGKVGSIIEYAKTVTNFESGFEAKSSKIPLVSQNQLLKINSHVSYPFANRLVEYLVDNAITPGNETPDNIKRLQKQLAELYPDQMAGYVPGIWEEKYKFLIYAMATGGKATWLKTKTDILGFGDKDIEQKLGSDVDIYGGDE